ncbi:MAG TPA: TIGR00730 family Rossman fold protein [Egicoccus sp.]|nr:TIGR00730 family Rossman fold protein [Egicoccus sp.]HSK24742.1 TIGR00730 family Rossman fold protein [Egicoccus sp.]
MTTFTVYTSSSDAIDPRYGRAATEFGRRIGERGDALVYGGTNVGVMGVLAQAVRDAGGHVSGVIPKLMYDRGIADEACDDLVVTNGMNDRKEQMIARGDAFVALPGGFGTLEELLEVLTLKQLGYHRKPIVLFNLDGFYDPLLAFFGELYDTRFAAAIYAELYHVATDLDGLFDHVDGYVPPHLPAKWA